MMEEGAPIGYADITFGKREDVQSYMSTKSTVYVLQGDT
jgi:hypothetical protein